MNTEKLNEGESPDHVSEESAESQARVDKGKQGGNRRGALIAINNALIWVSGELK